MYALGVDLGTTWTAASVWRDGRAEIAPLGAGAFSVPSVVLADPDGGLIVGEAAAARALTSPQLVAREFKRRFGQDVPFLLGDRELSPAELTSALLGWVVRTVSEREGETPGRVALTVPATWGSVLVDALLEVADGCGVPDAVIVREPAAAAIHYAARTRVPAGTTIGVYDFGGGTFDAAVLRKTDTGFELLGTPEGDGRLGGSDLDDVLLRDVSAQLGPAWAALDRRDPAVRNALANLRTAVTRARETLSDSPSAVVVASAPGLNQEVAVTRQRLDQLCAPLVIRSAEVFEDAVALAGLSVSDLDVVLLVGGASRTPLVARTILGRFGIEASTDAHPKSAVCLGAAISAGAALATAPPVVRPVPVRPEPVREEPPAGEPEAPTPVAPEPVAPEPVAPEPVASEPVAPEPVAPEPVHGEPARQEPARQEPARREPVRREPVPWQPVRQEPVRPQPVPRSPAPARPARPERVPVAAPATTHWAPSLDLPFSEAPTQPLPRVADTAEIPVVREPDYVLVDLVAAGLSAVDDVPTRPAVPLAPRLRPQAADQATVDLSDPGYRDQARRSALTVVGVVAAVLVVIAVLGILTR